MDIPIYNEIIKGFKTMKRLMTLIFIIVLLTDLTSCHSYLEITEQKDFKSVQTKKNVKVLSIITKQYKTFYFSKRFPGEISNGEVIGPCHVLLKSFEPDSIIYKNSSIQIVIPKAHYAIKNGIRYNVILQDNIELVCLESETTRIPISEISKMYIKENHPEKATLLVLGIIGFTTGLIYLIAFLTFPY